MVLQTGCFADPNKKPGLSQARRIMPKMQSLISSAAWRSCSARRTEYSFRYTSCAQKVGPMVLRPRLSAGLPFRT
jgi:hypothetical protein